MKYGIIIFLILTIEVSEGFSKNKAFEDFIYKFPEKSFPFDTKKNKAGNKIKPLSQKEINLFFSTKEESIENSNFHLFYFCKFPPLHNRVILIIAEEQSHESSDWSYFLLTYTLDGEILNRQSIKGDLDTGLESYELDSTLEMDSKTKSLILTSVTNSYSVVHNSDYLDSTSTKIVRYQLNSNGNWIKLSSSENKYLGHILDLSKTSRIKLSDKIMPEKMPVYQFRGKKGQKLSVSVQSEINKNDLVFSIIAPEDYSYNFNGKLISPSNTTKNTWIGILPNNGVYYIKMGLKDSQTVNYIITISLLEGATSNEKDIVSKVHFDMREINRLTFTKHIIEDEKTKNMGGYLTYIIYLDENGNVRKVNYSSESPSGDVLMKGIFYYKANGQLCYALFSNSIIPEKDYWFVGSFYFEDGKMLKFDSFIEQGQNYQDTSKKIVKNNVLDNETKSNIQFFQSTKIYKKMLSESSPAKGNYTFRFPQDNDESIIVRGINVNLRKKPSLKSQVVTKMKGYYYIKVLSVGNEEKIEPWGTDQWYFIEEPATSTKGWVFGAFLEPVETPVE